MITGLRTPAAYRRPGPDHAPLDYLSCRAKALGLAVAYHRRLHGLALGTAAACAELTATELDAIETGIATPTVDTLFALADVYRTNAVDLFAEALRIADQLFNNRWRPAE
jgi:transcriptional regulator with XRE-family HTH domain